MPQQVRFCLSKQNEIQPCCPKLSVPNVILSLLIVRWKTLSWAEIVGQMYDF